MFSSSLDQTVMAWEVSCAGDQHVSSVHCM